MANIIIQIYGGKWKYRQDRQYMAHKLKEGKIRKMKDTVLIGCVQFPPHECRGDRNTSFNLNKI